MKATHSIVKLTLINRPQFDTLHVIDVFILYLELKTSQKIQNASVKVKRYKINFTVE